VTDEADEKDRKQLTASRLRSYIGWVRRGPPDIFT